MGCAAERMMSWKEVHFGRALPESGSTSVSNVTCFATPAALARMHPPIRACTHDVRQYYKTLRHLGRAPVNDGRTCMIP